MGEFVRILGIGEIPVNQGKVVESRGRYIAVFNVNGRFCAIDNTCPHRGGPLGEGDLEGTIVTCPWHSWAFDVTTGVSPANPAACVKRFNCKVEGTDIFIEVD